MIETTRGPTADWIKRIAADERKRDDVRVREDEVVAHREDLVRRSGRRLVNDLRVAIARDAVAFRREFEQASTRDILVNPDETTGGFVVRKPASPAVTLTVTPHLDAAVMDCRYEFTSVDGLPPREHRLQLVFTPGPGDTLQIRTPSTGRVFESADALSEYLLVPVFTGRPR